MSRSKRTSTRCVNSRTRARHWTPNKVTSPADVGERRPEVLVGVERRDPGAQQNHRGHSPQENDRQAEERQPPYADLAPSLIGQDRPEEDEVRHHDDCFDARARLVLLRLLGGLACGEGDAGDSARADAVRACGRKETLFRTPFHVSA